MMHDLDRLRKRNKQFWEIIRLMHFPAAPNCVLTGLPAAQALGLYDHDIVFWAGDLNYRMEARLLP